MQSLTLEAADIIANKSLEKGRALGFAPLTVVILDAGGQIKVIKREDGSSLLRSDIAMGKAWVSSGWDLAAGRLPDGQPKCPPSSMLYPIYRAAEWFRCREAS